MQHFCKKCYFLKDVFRPFFLKDISIFSVRDDIKDQFSSYLKSLA